MLLTHVPSHMTDSLWQIHNLLFPIWLPLKYCWLSRVYFCCKLLFTYLSISTFLQVRVSKGFTCRRNLFDYDDFDEEHILMACTALKVWIALFGPDKNMCIGIRNYYLSNCLSKRKNPHGLPVVVIFIQVLSECKLHITEEEQGRLVV